MAQFLVNNFLLIGMKIKSTRPPGRPRKFDRDTVLDRAVLTFWEMGYKGASLDDLTESMGINRPSLYAAFGSKHDLFMEVIDRYAATLGCKPVMAFHGEAEIKEAVAAFFEASIRAATLKGKPRGCLIVSVAVQYAEKDKQVGKKLSGMFAEMDRLIADHFQVAQDKGQLSQKVDPQALARMVISVTHSIAARARVGASREELSRLAKDFMAVLFPAPN